MTIQKEITVTINLEAEVESESTVTNRDDDPDSKTSPRRVVAGFEEGDQITFNEKNWTIEALLNIRGKPRARIERDGIVLTTRMSYILKH